MLMDKRKLKQKLRVDQQTSAPRRAEETTSETYAKTYSQTDQVCCGDAWISWNIAGFLMFGLSQVLLCHVPSTMHPKRACDLANLG